MPHKYLEEQNLSIATNAIFPRINSNIEDINCKFTIVSYASIWSVSYDRNL